MEKLIPARRGTSPDMSLPLLTEDSRVTLPFAGSGLFTGSQGCLLCVHSTPPPTTPMQCQETFQSLLLATGTSRKTKERRNSHLASESPQAIPAARQTQHHLQPQLPFST